MHDTKVTVTQKGFTVMCREAPPFSGDEPVRNEISVLIAGMPRHYAREAAHFNVKYTGMQEQII
jgi:hypothetical protein